MTEPENFEEDLFADLYDDNDASKAGPGPKAPAQPAVEAQPVHVPDTSVPSHEPDIGGDAHMNQDDDDDDDVDFNLGGSSSAVNHASNNNAATFHDDVPTPPPYGTVHKASAKEDG